MVEEIEISGFWVYMGEDGQPHKVMISDNDPIVAPNKSVIGKWVKGVFASEAIEICKSAVFGQTTWQRHFNTAVKRYDMLASQLAASQLETQRFRIALRKIACQRVAADPKNLVLSYRALVDIANEALREDEYDPQ